MNRLFSIDLLRGLVMLLMTIDHTRDMFSAVNIGDHLDNLSAAYYFTRWITHFCAPTFVFLSGLSIALWIKKYSTSLIASQIHVIKRGLFIALLDVSFASLLWTIIAKQPIFTIYLSELWVLGWGMILLALLLNFSTFTIFLVGVILIASHDFLQLFASNTIINTLLLGNGEYDLTSSIHIVANYAILPWFGITCIGYVAGDFLIRRRQLANVFFVGSVVISLTLFAILRFLNIYGDSHSFVYHSGDSLGNLLSFLDVTKYPPSLQYILITSTLSWCVLIFRNYLENLSHSKILQSIVHYGQAPLFYYLLHLTFICIYSCILTFVFNQPFKTVNLLLVYLLAILIAVTAYPLLILFKKYRDQYKMKYPILSYI